jgi:hypothetical protein
MSLYPDQLKEVDNRSLREWIDRSKAIELDLQERLAKRVSLLQCSGRMHGSEPVYQALFFALAKLRQQLKDAEKEMSIRERAQNGRRR